MHKNKWLSKHVTMKTTDSGNLVFEVLGNPFVGPEKLDGKDFHGDYFSAKTDFGDEYGVDVHLATLDHALAFDEKGERYMHPMKMVIGRARYSKTDELGRWYELEVTRGGIYQEMLQDLYEKKMLYASSQGIPTLVTRDAKTGHIDSWVNAEIALTTHAANPEAVVNLMKKYEIPSKDFSEEEFLKTAKVIEESLRETTEAADVIEAISPDMKSNEEVEETLSDFVESTFNKAALEEEAEEAEAQVVEEEEEIEEVTEEATTEVAVEDDSRLENIEKSLQELADQFSQILEVTKAVNNRTTNLESGFKTFTRMTVESLPGLVNQRAKKMANMTEVEQDALIEAEAKNYGPKLNTPFPSHAPGS